MKKGPFNLTVIINKYKKIKIKNWIETKTNSSWNVDRDWLWFPLKDSDFIFDRTFLKQNHVIALQFINHVNVDQQKHTR